jgi:hypothetical protein
MAKTDKLEREIQAAAQGRIGWRLRTASMTARGSARAVERHPALFAGTALAIGAAAALAFFFGRTLRDEVARLRVGDAPRPITPERALALIDEAALSLIPTSEGSEFDQQSSYPMKAQQDREKEPLLF